MKFSSTCRRIHISKEAMEALGCAFNAVAASNMIENMNTYFIQYPPYGFFESKVYRSILS